MAPPKATPESRKDSYGTRGRPLSDWEALKELWEGSARVREASNDAFTRFEKHAYAQPATQREESGRELTELIWAEMRAAGYEVATEPVHFVKAPASETPRPAAARSERAGAARDVSAPVSERRPPIQSFAAIAVAVLAVLLVLRALRRRRS